MGIITTQTLKTSILCNQTKQLPNQTIIMDTIKQAGNYVSDKVQSATHNASKEANKETAKDSNAPIGTRAEAGYDALKDKSKEHSHDAQAEANKQAATH